MKIRAAALSTLVALASGAGALADVVKGPDLVATGEIVSVGNTSLVLRTDDHAHSIPFVVGTTTDLPPSLAAGSRVTVHYHPVGVDRQIADRVVVLGPRVASMLAQSAPSPATSVQSPSPTQPTAPTQAPEPAASPGTPEEPGATELPRTASPLPLVGLIGLAAFLASALLRTYDPR